MKDLVDLVLASHNRGKLNELRELLAAKAVRLQALSAFTTGEADEPHPSFVENALAKARHAAQVSGLPALADDSGLCVEALGGAPGIRSARYAGEPRSDSRNNDHLLRQLQGLGNRKAHYCCVLVLLRRPDDPQPLIAEGQWHGSILEAPRGTGGFGYDPLFWLPELGLSAAELEPAHKNAISHRAIALRTLAERLSSQER